MPLQIKVTRRRWEEFLSRWPDAAEFLSGTAISEEVMRLCTQHVDGKLSPWGEERLANLVHWNAAVETVDAEFRRREVRLAFDQRRIRTP